MTFNAGRADPSFPQLYIDSFRLGGALVIADTEKQAKMAKNLIEQARKEKSLNFFVILDKVDESWLEPEKDLKRYQTRLSLLVAQQEATFSPSLVVTNFTTLYSQ
jgi:hypothetical protein